MDATRVGGRAANNEVSPDFLSQYGATLEAAVSTLSDAAIKRQLQEIVRRVAPD
jgi:hypothetical protein